MISGRGQTIDDRIQGNLADIKATQAILAPKVDKLMQDIYTLRAAATPSSTPR